MKSVHTILSSLLAGMMMFSLAACTASGTGASGSDSSAVQTDAVPQGRWVERQADGISSGLVLGAAPAALADGSLVLYARDESTDMPVTVRLNSTDNGASWQSEPLDWAEKTGTLARWAARQDGTVAFTTTDSTLWVVQSDGNPVQLDLGVDGGNFYLNQMGFLPDGTLVAVPSGGPGVSLPGNILFYDVDAQKVKSWVQVSSGNQSWMGAGADASGENYYFGDNDIAGILPAGDENGSFLYYFSSNGDLCRADQDGTTQTLARQFGIREDLLAEMPQTGYTEDAGGDVAYIQGKGTLVVGITEFAPMDYKDDNGQWTGFDAELARLVAQRLGVDVEFVIIEWGQKVNELNSKAIDVVWNGMTLTDGVQTAMTCTPAYCRNAQVIVVPAA